MAIPQKYIDEATVKLAEINKWFEDQVIQNPSAVMSLNAQRGTRIKQEIYATFSNQRGEELEKLRDENKVTLSCSAGRGSAFGSVPKGSKIAVIEADDSNWINVPEETYIEVHNDIAGGSSFQVSEDKRKVNFEVHCRGVAFEDTTRGHGAHEATLHAVFRMTKEAKENQINLETLELSNIIGV
ncbi:hypothetical protein COK59_16085 [Bacillus thuringiensis]|uniref:hypothetical protein n=1 Tax=Bacillus thuringiensis TaxID=1428 RepID=UPI000BEB63FA|nr:hypothetical protein [Bacillus thuringiensis]PEC70914.1 hypothetical protein CON25_25450 [Bacillus thuringiensis]PFT07485.1 hypothetical protein COK59_16085 [Bacillus thuringiensis]PFU58164.1 hypothetical protein COK85_17870 [Bacillus thuringiensis]